MPALLMLALSSCTAITDFGDYVVGDGGEPDGDAGVDMGSDDGVDTDDGVDMADAGDPPDADGGPDVGPVDEGMDLGDRCDMPGACVPGDIVSCSLSCGPADTGSGPCTDRCTPPSGDACQPPEEVCDGADNDCDGRIDEGKDYAPTTNMVTLATRSDRPPDLSSINFVRVVPTSSGPVVVFVAALAPGNPATIGRFIGAARLNEDGSVGPVDTVAEIRPMTAPSVTLQRFNATSDGDRIWVTWSGTGGSSDGLLLNRMDVPAFGPLQRARSSALELFPDHVGAAPQITVSSDSIFITQGGRAAFLGRAERANDWSAVTAEDFPSNPRPLFLNDGTPTIVYSESGNTVSSVVAATDSALSVEDPEPFVAAILRRIGVSEGHWLLHTRDNLLRTAQATSFMCDGCADVSFTTSVSDAIFDSGRWLIMSAPAAARGAELRVWYPGDDGIATTSIAMDPRVTVLSRSLYYRGGGDIFVAEPNGSASLALTTFACTDR
ncbi:MAG: hypothetical protein AAF411_12805 [Myxococcota bacterium]